MLRSKKDVDRHVRDLLSKVKTEEERKVRGYNIARLYYNISEYESARRYLNEFLSVRPKAVDAHRLLGQIYEGLGNKEKAIQAFKNAYELGEGQKDLILKICELYTEVQADTSVRLYWAEEGQRVHPHHESVVKLREALLTASPAHSRQDLEKLYIDEIKANPTVVRLQTNLLQLYKDWGAEDKNKLKEAYNYGCQVEARKAFSDSLEWYQTLMEVLQTYQGSADVNSDVEFHINHLSALERLVYLTLSACSGTALVSQSTLTDVAALLHKFDQELQSSISAVGAESQFGQLMIGQLYFHMAIFLMHSAKKDGLTPNMNSAAVLLFHACRVRGGESGSSGGNSEGRSWRVRDQAWHKLACHRLSQAAHVLKHMATSHTAEKAQFLNKVIQQCCNKEAQVNVYHTLYGPSLANKKENSYFLNDGAFINAPVTYPEADQIKEWDNVVGSTYCGSLCDLVWLCLQQVSGDLQKPQPYYTFTLFEGLQFSASNVNTGAPETLCHLDLLAFLAATVYCQVAAAKESHGPAAASLPRVLVSGLSTTEQSEWWVSAYTLFTNRAHHRLTKLRMVLQRGLEVIRAHGNHGVELPLMAHLAHCFTHWATEAEGDGSTSSEVEALRERGEHYWQRVLTLSQRAARNLTTITPRNPLFTAPNVSLSREDGGKVEEEGKYFLAMRLVQGGRQQEAIQALADLKSPEASFQRAMLYKEQAQSISSSDGVGGEGRSQQMTLLTQARDTLYLTLDRLRMPGVDRFHPLNTKLSQQLEDVERRLSHVNLETSMIGGQQQREDDSGSLSEASHSPNIDITNGELGLSSSQPLHLFSTPHRDKSAIRIQRQEARPSPERLDAQLRALSEVQETTLRNMEEQNAALKVQNEALRNFCTTMADEVRENSVLYRTMLEQNKSLAQEAHASVLNEMRNVNSSIKDLQGQVHILAADIADLKSMKSAMKPQEVVEVRTSEEQVPVDLPATAAVVTPGLYGSYMGYYGQQPVPSPLMPTPGIFGNPPFFPPSTLPEQSYSLASSVGDGGGISTLAQVTSGLVTPSPRPITSHLSSLTHQGGDCSPGTLSWSVGPAGTPTTSATAPRTYPIAIPATPTSTTPAAATTPPHAFQITMPPSSATLTPPSRSTPGEPLSLTLPCSTTDGLLANVPPPLYSAVTPDSSPVRGQTGGVVEGLSVLSTVEGMSPAPPPQPSSSYNIVAPPSTSGSQDSSITFLSVTSPSMGGIVPVSGGLVPVGGGDMKVYPCKTGGAADDDNDSYLEDDHDPCPDFKPIVPLPEKVEVRTGEEDEHVLFEERSKLFRFVEKEWRERGTGIMKLLHNPAQGHARVLMRRDQTHKICANHLIASNIELQPMKNNDKVWIWAAQDYADEELRFEKFCCRFKSVEIATSFRDAFMKAKAIAKEKEESETSVNAVPEPTKTPSAPTSSSQQQPSLAEMFKPAAGSWSCQMCLVSNKAESVMCVACETPNPSAPQPQTITTPAQPPFASFKFTSPSSGSEAVTNSTVGFKFISSPSVTITKTTQQPPSTTTSTLSGFSFKFGVGENDRGSSGSGNVVQAPAASPIPDTTTTNTPKDTSKFSLSGFTFTTTPTIKPDQPPAEDVPTQAPPEDKKKDSVFAGFSFGSSPANAGQTAGFMFGATGATPKSEDIAAASSGSIFGNKTSTSSTVNFGGFPANASPATAFTTKNSKTFEGKSVLSGVSSSPVKSPMKDNGDDHVEEYEPQVDFQPVIPMPDLVDVKTGEEEEEVLFCERSKLFRYDKDSKEWKERGVGDLKILKNNVSEKIRVLMRREQVLKVCANHFISPVMKLAPMASSDKAWTWAAQDFADQEMKEQQFAARFKNQEIAQAFKTAFDNAQKALESAPKVESSSSAASMPSTTSTPSLAALFRPAVGSWECDACLVRNSADKNTCAACSSNKPGYEPPADAVQDAAKPAISFGIQQSEEPSSSLSGGFKFGACDNKTPFSFGIQQTTEPPASVSSSQQPFSFGTKTKENETSSTSKVTFSFGLPSSQPSSSQDTTDTATDAKPAFSFGSTGHQEPNKPFNFSWQPTTDSGAETSGSHTTVSSTTPVPIPNQQQPSTPTKGDKKDFIFGSPGKYEFSFAGVKAKSPRSRDISLCESEDGLVEEDDGDHLYFEPVVPLPDKVEVVTGEEDETMLYSHRAKLFRLVAGEWKERGIGDIKLLSHNQTQKIRLIMRREQVHKICLNHYMKKDLEFRKKDDKTFYWASMDYSDNTPQNETFAIRFKTPEIAFEFFKAANDAKVKLGGTAMKLEPPSAQSSPAPAPQESRVSPPTPVVVSAATPSPITIPTPFTPAPTSPISPITTPTPVVATSCPTASPFAGAPLFAGSAAGTATPSIFGGNTTVSPSVFGGTPKSSSSVFGGSGGNSIFSKGAASPSIFGGAASTTTSVFGGTQSFGGSTVFGGFGNNSIVGGSTTTSAVPRSSFSFGDKISSEPETSDGVEVVYEQKATPEQVEKARKLQLPDNFFLYEMAKPCPGCIGCEDREKAPKVELNQTKVKSEPSTQFGKPGYMNSPLFTSNTPTSSPSIFAKTSAFNSPSVFGSTPSSSPSLFSDKSAGAKDSVFGGKAAESTLFGSSAKVGESPLFGGSAKIGESALFGSSTKVGESPSFGGSAKVGESTGSLFGGSAKVGESPLFSGSAKVGESTGSLFGGSAKVGESPLFGGSAKVGESTGSLFGGSAKVGESNLFGGSTKVEESTSSFFGGSAKVGGSNLFGGVTLGSTRTTTVFSATNTTTTPSGGSLFSNTDTSLTSFGDVASNTADKPFGQNSPSSSSVWSARGQPVFKTSPKKDSSVVGEDGEVEGDDNSHDPQFEPVVPLPDLIEVKTGEEAMEVIFSNRSKLYRYDGPTKQWKERGVGDFKILHDVENRKYRLIMRRELVHKLCCNHLLTPQLDLKPLQTSETAWCWYTIDYSENIQGTNEQLALRFKTVALAQEFKTKFLECQEQLRNFQASNSTTTDTSAVVVLPQSHHMEEEEDDEEEDDEDEEEEEEEDSEEEEDEDEDDDGEETPVILFSDRCVLSKKDKDTWVEVGCGELRIQYNDEVFGAQVLMTSDSGDILADHLIAIQTVMHRQASHATWTVLNLRPEPATHTTFKAIFSSEDSLESFSIAFKEGKDCAEKAPIYEKQSVGGMEPSSLYYGQGLHQEGVGAERLVLGATVTTTNENAALPFNLNEMVSCDPILTQELASALQEYSPSLDSEGVED